MLEITKINDDRPADKSQEVSFVNNYDDYREINQLPQSEPVPEQILAAAADPGETTPPATPPAIPPTDPAAFADAMPTATSASHSAAAPSETTLGLADDAARPAHSAHSAHSTGPARPSAAGTPIRRRHLALLLAACIVFSGAAGIGGGLLANRYLNQPSQATTALNSGAATTAAAVSSVAVVPTSTAVTLQTSSRTQTLTIPEIASIAAPSVVEIQTEVLTTDQRMRQYVTEGAGSGVILSADGYIVTNNHVIEDAQKITVITAEGQSYAATLVGTDPQTDLAVIKIAASGLTPATLGDSSTLVVGDLAVAIGNPLGELGGTVTDGIISALDREITIDDETMNLLQTNAAINPGNSGGGLFDAAGNLIGVVNAKSSGTNVEGLGFAIPVNDVKAVVNELISFGFVQGRIEMGMTLLDIDSEQAAMMYRVSSLGVYVLKVTSDSTAATAGFESGDRVVSLNGNEVATAAGVNTILKQLKAGDSVQVVIQRGQQQQTLTWVLEARQNA